MLTSIDYGKIDAAIKVAEKTTSAKIKVVVLPASDDYQEFVLFYGLVVGSIASLVAWKAGIISTFPWLLSVQFGTIILFDLMPLLRQACTRLLPTRILRHRATQRAFFEYYIRHADIFANEPFVLLFVSLAERYAHVITNPVVHKQIPDNWNLVTEQLVVSVNKEGIVTACAQAVATIAEILKRLPADVG